MKKPPERGRYKIKSLVTREHEEEIRKHIFPDVDKRVLASLFEVINQVLKEKTYYYSADPITGAELRDELQTMTESLTEIREKLSRLNRRGGSIRQIDDHYYLANGNDSTLWNLRNSIGLNTEDIEDDEANFNHTNSGAEEILIRMQAGISGYRNSLSIKGEGGAPKALRHLDLIKSLERFFKSNFPNIKPSASKSSKFFKLIEYIFQYLLEESTIDPTRHIKNALEIKDLSR
ncbi:MAG: hypothetical protein R3F50_08025 [Gammaproteobacteria bacterium]